MRAPTSIARIGDGLRARRRAGDSRVFTALTPIRPGRAGALGQTLRAFDAGERSPLAGLRYAHFARWVIIDQLKTNWPGAPRRPLRLTSAYLLFSASVTVPASDERYRFPHTLIDDLRSTLGDVADAVWGQCMGYPGVLGPDDFRAYLLSSRVRTGIHQFGYRGATVADVDRALTVHDAFADFAVHHRDEGGDALQRAYCEESATWPR